MIRKIFQERKPLICYFMAGYPSVEDSLKTAYTLIESGADILEVGFPFSDPVADGVTIQVAHEKAVKDGITPPKVFEITKNIKEKYPNIPLIAMTYYNPIFKVGEEKFCKMAKDSGIDGFIVPDLPPEEGKNFKETANKLDLSVTFLLAPTSDKDRIKLVSSMSDDFIYYVSLTGITGERQTLPWDELREKLSLVRKITDKKVAVGFGVSKGEHAKIISQIADGVIVGSAIVRLQGKKDFESLKNLVQELKSNIEV
ncbi:tryptophan synthase subunit alpha [Sulfurihydrogenibium sp.]|uniref:tryptophan synthase subunit alpha n=1 Tax=Sulfurihydrogenibium sp. TaxID=2053621 RepID=UPI003D14BDEB